MPKTRTNRLIDETSPYLLQHAYNPVDWYPWGEEAFDEAKRRDKPILLSIGYSACHWCHVMAHESFENEAIADIMNTHFVNIKVDREERPDLDQIYQNAVQYFIKRGGGWPLTMFLTPAQVPFHGGTYFPPEDRYQLPGFPKILLALAAAYRKKPEEVATVAQNVLTAIHRAKKNTTKPTLDTNILETAVSRLVPLFDTAHGGFGRAPKFPSTAVLTLFLLYYQQSGAQPFLDRVTHTLREMACGGVYDQFAGGFHRYSVDEAWQVPHFEKMLYDNAQLAPLYFLTYQASKDPFFKECGMDILDYVLREMTDTQGGFYAAQDADSEGGEGSFYTWSPKEIKAILGAETADLVCQYYQITETGNFEGKSIPHRISSSDFEDPSLQVLAAQIGTSETTVAEILRSARATLYAEREKRPKPFRDEKIMTSWTSLMIGAFVSGYQVTRDTRYRTAAVQAADFILDHLYQDGRLLHTFKDGKGKLTAYLDDTAFFANALMDLYEATAENRYLLTAQSLTNQLIAHFWDEKNHGFFYTANDHEALIDRIRPCFDHSVPSGNAAAAQALQRLSYFTGEHTYFERGERTLLAFAAEMEANPFAVASLIGAADFYLRYPKEIHVAGDLKSPEAEALLNKIHTCFLPHKLISFDHSDLVVRTWITKEKMNRSSQPEEGQVTVYICQNFTCSPPLTAWGDIKKTLLG